MIFNFDKHIFKEIVSFLQLFHICIYKIFLKSEICLHILKAVLQEVASIGIAFAIIDILFGIRFNDRSINRFSQ